MCPECKHVDKVYYGYEPCNYCIGNPWVRMQMHCTEESNEQDGFNPEKVDNFYED